MINNIQNQSQDALESTLNKLGYSGYNINLDTLPDASDAILASSVCYKISQDNEVSPAEIANEICENLDTSKIDYIDSVVNTGPYINFYPNDKWYNKLYNEATKSGFGSDQLEAKKVSVEHTSVNPTGPLHIGRVRNSVLGDTLANILAYCGYNVTRDYYVNDTGLQVAILTWAYENYDKSDLPDTQYNGDHYDLVRYYQKAYDDLDTSMIKEIQQDNISINSGKKEKEVVDIMNGLENQHEDTKNRVSSVVSKMLNAQVKSLENIGIEFDNFTHESEYMGSPVKSVIKNLKNSKKSVKKDGAWMIKFTDIDKPFVFQRSNGTSLYGTRDIAYHIEKLESFDEAILVLGEDQELHAKSVKSSLELLGYNSGKINVVHHAFVRTPDGGMSTRQGEGDFIEDVINKSTQKALEIMNAQDIEDEKSVAQDIATGSLRYNMLSKSRLQLSTFDAQDAVSVKSQTGPGIQYTYARLNSIIDNTNKPSNEFDPNIIQSPEIYELLNKISEFPSVLYKVSKDMKPHYLTTYVKELNDNIKEFYENCPVKYADSEEIRANRLHIVKCSINILEISMDLLGIPKVENM